MVKLGVYFLNNSENFLEKYKKLEETVRVTYKIKDQQSISYYLSEQSKYKWCAEEIKYCQDVRNILAHKRKINNSYAVEPNENMIKFIDDLIEKIKNRPRCSNVQIPFNKVYWRSLSDTVKDTITQMKENLFTHIPILDEKKRVIGVFDENSVFEYISNEEIMSIDENLKFSDILKYLSLDNREMESFIFVKANSFTEDLEDKIEIALKKGKRIGLAFVTVNGNPNEKLQGIITPWDLIE